MIPDSIKNQEMLPKFIIIREEDSWMTIFNYYSLLKLIIS
jgi:hypothetical protein